MKWYLMKKISTIETNQKVKYKENCNIPNDRYLRIIFVFFVRQQIVFTFVSICLRSTDNGTLSSSWNTPNIAHAQHNLKRKIDLTTTKEKLEVKNKGRFQSLFHFICPVYFFFQERHLQKWDLSLLVRFIFFFLLMTCTSRVIPKPGYQG